MTHEEKLIVSIYTGYLMVDFDDLHKYAEELMGGPILTHELADGTLCDELREKVKADFLKLCKE